MTAGTLLQAGADGAGSPYADLDLLGTFVDNHDNDRLASTCEHDPTRLANALAFAFGARGVPILYAGTEQGMAGDRHNHNRVAMWTTPHGFDTSAPLYSLLASLNRVRREASLGAARTFPVPSLYLPCTFPVPSLQGAAGGVARRGAGATGARDESIARPQVCNHIRNHIRNHI
jgi:hypothetical protein